MTKFVKVRIDLQQLAVDARTRALEFRKRDEPMSLVGVKIESVQSAGAGATMLDGLSVAVTLPDAVVEPSVSLGTSVFAAGQIALQMGKKWLMSAGLSKTVLDQVSIANVVLEAALITYLVPVSSTGRTQPLMHGIHQDALLLGLDITWQPTVNRTTYRPGASDSAATLAGAALVLDWRAVQSHVCLHVSLDASYLERRGWTALESWRTAYQESRYRLIFDNVVRGMLRLDGKASAHPEPRVERYDHLSISNAALLGEHIVGHDALSYGGFPMCARSKEKSDAKAWRAARLQILTITGVDIRKPWSSYRVFRPRLLMKALIYPGDYSPPSGEVPLRFCEENWPDLLERLI
jgi:hypothetical protein